MKDFVKTQGYAVEKQLRITASEIDLDCIHGITSEKIFVECKAHRDPLSSEELRKTLGTLYLHSDKYSQSWFLSAGPLGKDAKGLLTEWESKPLEIRKSFTVFTPERIIQSFIDAKIIQDHPNINVNIFKLDDNFTLGEWGLLVSKLVKHWYAPMLYCGTTKYVVFYDAKTCLNVSDQEFVANIKGTDFTLKEYEFYIPSGENPTPAAKIEPSPVVPVEFGDKWIDYRPARPEHFVGRKYAQKELFQLFSQVKSGSTSTRIFAITGDSGIGKSSLLAKMRELAQKRTKPGNIFFYAVDLRAANDASYIGASLVNALNEAAALGFGDRDIKIAISNHSDPFESESIKLFLDVCKKNRQLIVLAFDQFEELYIKKKMLNIFEEARKLMFSAIHASNNIILGYAWKTDSTVPQDHPAYHMWHQLSDHRLEIQIKQFTHADAEQSISIFEKELNEKIRPELRKYILENSQGYPWLLKKLCIHLYERLQNNANQHHLISESFEISTLFDDELRKITPQESKALVYIAQNSPIDIVDAIDNLGHEVIQSLQDKRFIIKRGTKLNTYWDIFRDYILTKSIPSIPFSYIPQSPSLDALIRVALALDTIAGVTMREISIKTRLEESTIRNIVHDLNQFGIAFIDGQEVLLYENIKSINFETILRSVRDAFKRHKLTTILKEMNSIKPATHEDVIQYLKDINPIAQHHNRTWNSYARRMVQWLQLLGLADKNSRGDTTYKDSGDILQVENIKKISRIRQKLLFIGDTSPAKVIEALKLLQKGPVQIDTLKSMGYRNACAILYRFMLIYQDGDCYAIHSDHIDADPSETIWKMCAEEESVNVAKEMLQENPSLSGEQLGSLIAKEFKRDWKLASKIRTGNSLRQWAGWLLLGKTSQETVPPPPGKLESSESKQLSLFDCLPPFSQL